jgi:cell shape-determining protein MreC
MLALALDLTQAVTVGVLVSGVVAGLAVILKTPREAGQIAVTAAEGAVVVQSGVIESLRAELDRVKEDNASLAQRVDELATVAAEAERNRVRIEELETERGRLTQRVGELEMQNLQLREELDIVKERTTERGTA